MSPHKPHWETPTYNKISDDFTSEGWHGRGTKAITAFRERAVKLNDSDQVLLLLRTWPDEWFGLPDIMAALRWSRSSHNYMARICHELYHSGAIQRWTSGGQWTFTALPLSKGERPKKARR